MMLEWTSGLNNYRKHTLEFGSENIFTVELQNTTENFNNIEECFLESIKEATSPVEVLYSGGLDSEFVIAVCREFNIPVIALTLRLLISGAAINTHDLYYAEKFCREYGVSHKIIDLDIEKFLENGNHIAYLEPYRIPNIASATIMHLIDQCHNFPIYGGDYSWPLLNVGMKAYSPHRHDFNCYDHFIQQKGSGIGNMLGHTMTANKILITEHLNTFQDNNTFKYNIFKKLGYNLEPRHRSHGWENIHIFKSATDIKSVVDDLKTRYGPTKNIIKWEQTLGSLIGSESGENFDYGR